MKKALLFFALIISIQISAYSQNTATDFTTTDCDGNAHNLFSELDNGRVIILVWVMPCGACTGDAVEARDAFHRFWISHPGRVAMYLADDDGSTDCADLSTWANANGLGGLTGGGVVLFENSFNVINQANYGGMGMPHVVVLGGSDHKIYYNALNGTSDSAALDSAINQALSVQTAITNIHTNVEGISLFPRPDGSAVQVSYDLLKSDNVTIELLNGSGIRVQTISAFQHMGHQSINVPTDGVLPDGYYILRIRMKGGSVSRGFAITR